MSATLYATVMSILGLITGLYMLAIGLGWHTPRTRTQIPPAKLAKLRLWSKVAGVASLLLAGLYLQAALH